jgi:hypothetical protein
MKFDHESLQFRVQARARSQRSRFHTPRCLTTVALFVAVGCGSSSRPEPHEANPSPPQVQAPAPVATPAPATPTAPPAVRRSPQIVDIEVPKLRARVNDQAQVLSKPEAARLEAKLTAHERATGQQFALLTLRGLNGVSVENFGFTVANHWKLGRKGHDDGLLVLVGINERQVDIEVGTGLESAIPDHVAASVIQDQIAPAFRAQDYASGLNAAFDRLIAAAAPAKPSQQ